MEEQLIDETVLIVVKRCEEFTVAKDWVNSHLQHDTRKVMDLATVTVPIGVVDENQVSTAGTISVLNHLQKYLNDSGVSIINNHSFVWCQIYYSIY